LSNFIAERQASDAEDTFGNFTASRIASFIRFVELIEYQETLETPGFQENQDIVIKRYDLTNPAAWSPIGYEVKQATSPDGDKFNVYILSLCTVNNALCAYLAFTGRVLQVPPYVIDADSIKLTVVNYYTFTDVVVTYRYALSFVVGYNGVTVTNFPQNFGFFTDITAVFGAEMDVANTSTSLFGLGLDRQMIGTFEVDYKNDTINVDVDKVLKMVKCYFTFDEGPLLAQNKTIGYTWDMAFRLNIDYEFLRPNVTSDPNYLDRFHERVAITVAENQIREVEVVIYPVLRTVDILAVAIKRSNMTTTVDAFRLGLSNFFQATMDVQYYTLAAETTNNGDVDYLAAAAFAFGLRFYGIVEFVESGQTPGYQTNQDTTVAYYNFNRYWIWKPLKHERITVGTTTVDVFVMETRDGIFRVRLAFAGKPINIGTKSLDPQSFKFDVEIQTIDNGTTIYNYSNPNSRLALAVVVVAAVARTVRTSGVDNSSNSLDLNGNVQTGSFTWDTQVNGTDINGKTTFFDVEHNYENVYTDTNVTLDEGFSLSRIFFSFDAIRPQSISWDPEVAVNPDYEETSTTGAVNTNSASTTSSSKTGDVMSENSGLKAKTFSILTIVVVMLAMLL